MILKLFNKINVIEMRQIWQSLINLKKNTFFFVA